MMLLHLGRNFFCVRKKVSENSIFLRPRRLLYISWRAMTWVVSFEYFSGLNEKLLFGSLDVEKNRPEDVEPTTNARRMDTCDRVLRAERWKNFHEHRVSNFIVLLAVLWKWMEIMLRISVKSVRSVSAREGGKTIFKHNLCFVPNTTAPTEESCWSSEQHTKKFRLRVLPPWVVWKWE